MLTDVSLISIAASALVMLSVAFGSLSFRFAEEGTPPDRPHDPFHADPEPEKSIIVRGKRRRQRARARLFFNLGALCLLASVPLGYANARDPSLSSIFVLLALALIVGAVCYVAANLRALWLDRRADAFSAWYVGKKFGQFYRKERALRKLFFSINPDAVLLQFGAA